MAEFKDRLKQLRKEKGLTQQELGIHFEVSGVAIMRYEKGQRSPTLSYRSVRRYENGETDSNGASIISLADFFNVTTDYLLGVSDERVPVKNHLSKFTTDELIGEILKRAVKND